MLVRDGALQPISNRFQNGRTVIIVMAAVFSYGYGMRYVMREKFLALGDDFKIADEHGTDRFLVDGRAFSIGDKLSFQDMSGRELAFIRQRLLAWGPTYEVSQNGN